MSKDEINSISKALRYIQNAGGAVVISAASKVYPENIFNVSLDVFGNLISVLFDDTCGFELLQETLEEFCRRTEKLKAKMEKENGRD